MAERIFIWLHWNKYDGIFSGQSKCTMLYYSMLKVEAKGVNRYNFFMPPAHIIRFLLFGSPRIEVDGSAFSLPQRGALLRLFMRLALQADTPHARKTLAFLLWADVSEAEALANLRRHLYLLRNALPEILQPALIISTQKVTFHLPSTAWVDVTAFEREAFSNAEMESAATLYTGDLAQGVEADDFILLRREELRIRYLGLLRNLAQTYLEKKDYATSLRWARKLILQDPWDEEAARLCMTAEAMSGNRSAALVVYKTLEENLHNEIGAQPMPETMSLYRDILHNHLRRTSTRQSPAEWTLFIGREEELTVLQNALYDVQKGRGGFVFINGPAGVGKTALTRESIHRFLHADETRIFWGNCQPAEAERPYGLWQQIFNLGAPLLARRTDISIEWLNHLLPLVPDLGLLRAGLILPSSPDSAELRAALWQGVYALAENQPLVLAIEDAHWMDAASLEFLNELAGEIFQQPILFLITHRTEAPPLALLELKRALRRKRALQDLPLQAFTPVEVQAFLETALNVELVSSETLAEVSRYAEGMPLLLREAVQILRRQQQTYAAGKLPSLRESFRARLESLAPPAREMLETAAILGYSLADNELRGALQWKPEAYAAALDILQSERLLLENTRLVADEYSFPHHLIHQIILHEIPDTRAKKLKASVAQALETIHAQEAGFADEIASQYEQAGLLLPAARFWLKHAQESIDLAAFETGLASIVHAEGLLTDTDRHSQEIHAQAVLQRGVIALYQGQGESALNLLEKAVSQARPFPPLFANALSMQAYAFYTQDYNEAAYHSASQAFDLSMTLNDIPNAVRALNIRAVNDLMLGRHQNAVADLHQSLSLLEEHRLSASAQTVQSLNHLGTALVFAQDYAQAREILNRTKQLAAQGGMRRVESAALTMLGQVALNCGQYDQSIRIYDRAIEVAGESYLPGMWGKFAGRGWAHLRIGNPAAAQEDFERGLIVANQVESGYGRLLMRVYLTFTALVMGESPAASFPDLEAEAAALKLHAVALLTANLQGQLWRLLKDLDKAKAAHARAVDAAHSCNVPSFIQLARLQMMCDQAMEGDEVTELSSLYQSTLDSGEVPLQSLARLVGAYQLFHAKRLTEAISAAQQALTLARSCPDQPLIGECLLLLNRLYLEIGSQPQAETCRVEICTLAKSAFAPLWLGLQDGKDHPMHNILMKSLL